MPRQLESGAARGATEVKRLVLRFVAHRSNSKFSQGFREIWHVEIRIAIMEFGIFRKQFIGFVVRPLLCGRRGVRNYVAKPGMLKEMTPERVASTLQRLIAA